MIRTITTKYGVLDPQIPFEPLTPFSCYLQEENDEEIEGDMETEEEDEDNEEEYSDDDDMSWKVI